MTELHEPITIVETVEFPPFEPSYRDVRREVELKTKFQILDRSEQKFVFEVIDAVLSGAIKIPYESQKWEYD